MFDHLRPLFEKTLAEIRTAGLYKNERIIESSQSAEIRVSGKKVLNFCANNYLGLANHSRLKEAAKLGIDEYGYGLSSVRFICGTQTIHKALEHEISRFFGTEDSILYASCFDANAGIFEALLGERDAIVSDALNHASIIDGIRLCKAKRFVYRHGEIADLRRALGEARNEQAEKVLIATDGVFSMDGDIAKLVEICNLADEYQAMVMIDDCHATGFFGKTGRGTPEYCGATGRIDIINSTLGKALGGAVGGFSTGRREIIALLRQRSRPYLFSNSLPPAIICGELACLELLSESDALRKKLASNTEVFRRELTCLGFQIREGSHPIVPVMLGDAQLATRIADDLLTEGIYVIGFSYPVVPKGAARIRVQLSAAHTTEHVERAIQAFQKVGTKHGVCQ